MKMSEFGDTWQNEANREKEKKQITLNVEEEPLPPIQVQKNIS